MISFPRSFIAVASLHALFILPASGGQGGSDVAASKWVAGWRASMESPGPGSALFLGPQSRRFNNETLRQTAIVTANGKAIRIHLSNLYGDSPLHLSDLYAAIRLSGKAPSGGRNATEIEPGSAHRITFGGQATVEVAAGEEVVSAAGDGVTISFASPLLSPMATWHWIAAQTTYAAPGNQANSKRLANPESLSSFYWLSGIDVNGAPSQKVIAMFGDSITDGAFSTPDKQQRYPDALFTRLQANASSRRFAVINQGITGNRLLHDVAGPSAASRFRREVVLAGGVSHALVLIGINDIGVPGWLNRPDEEVTAEQIIGGLKAIAAQAKTSGIRVYIGTLLPFEGMTSPGFFSASGEDKRQAVNAWIRSNSDFDATVDFDLAMRDPAHPSRLLAAYDSGDHLHPNDAGYAAMANAVDLKLFDQ
jgi:lysophospholipase L1-like esterase